MPGTVVKKLSPSLFIWLVLTGMLVHLGIIFAYANRLNLDVAHYVSMAQMLAEGGVPYRDIMDVNPPLIIYLSLVPLWVQDVLPLDIVRATHLSVLLYLLATGALTLWSLKYLAGDELRTLRFVFAAVMIYMAVEFLLHNDFGQRDHLIAMGLLPYAILRASLFRQNKLSLQPELLAGVLAAVMLLLKPMYATIPLAVETMLLWHTGMRGYLRTWRVPVIAASTVLLLFVIVAPLRVYAVEWWPVITSWYSAYGYNVKKVVMDLGYRGDTRLMLMVLALAVAALWVLQDERRTDLLKVLLIFAFGGFLGMVVQGKGWSYHFIPYLYGLWLSAGVLFYLFMRTIRRKAISVNYAALWTVLLLAVMQLSMYPSLLSKIRRGPPPAPQGALLDAIREHSLQDDLIVMITPGVERRFSAVTSSGRSSGSRYLSAFPIVLAYADTARQEPLPQRAWLAKKYRDELWTDITAKQPALLIVDIMPGRFSMHSTMSMHTWLERERFFTHGPGREYAYLQTLDNELAMYKRNPSDKKN